MKKAKDSSDITENVEMYLKYVYLLSRENGGTARTGDISKFLHVSPSSVTEMLERLQDEGLVRHRKYQGASLTWKGRDVAKRTLQRHCTMEYFLVKELGVPESRFHDEACRMEHALSDESTEKLRKKVGQPSTCPACYDLSKLHCKYLISK